MSRGIIIRKYDLSGYIVLLIFLAILTAIMPCSASDQNISAKDFTYITEQHPPNNFQDGGKLQGITVDILEKIWENMNISMNRSAIELLPWTEGYQRALKEKNTVIFSTTRLPQREKLFKWVGPIEPVRGVLLTKSDNSLIIQADSDLKKYKIGTIKDDMAVQMLLDRGLKKDDLILETAAKPIIEMLQNGTIEAWAYNEVTGLWLIRNAGLNPDDFKIAYVLGQGEDYYAFNINTPDSLVQSFQQALYHVKNDKSKEGVSDYERILYKYLPVGYSADNMTDSQVTGLVNLTAEEIKKNASDTIEKINAGDDPYKNKSNPKLYEFVYDIDVNVVAHADNPLMIGKNFKGKGDVSGKKFRDEIVAGALKNGTGWEDYIYSSPAESGLYHKTAYYKLAKGNDGKDYILCSGKYKSK